MQILPDWLALGRKTGSSNELASTDWLKDPALDDPLTAAEMMRQRLPELMASQHNQPSRLKLLEALFEKTRRILPAIEHQVETATLPLPNDALQAALAADNLLKGLATGYLALLNVLRAQKVPAASSSIGRLATLRSMECMTRRQQLAFRAYAPPSTSTWQLIHQTYIYARQQELSGFSSGGRTVEHEYIIALLLAWADPTKFSRTDFAPLVSCLIHYAPLVKIRKIDSQSVQLEEQAPVYLVRDDDTGAGRRLSKPPQADPEHDAWLVDCWTLLAALNQNVHQRELNEATSGPEATTPLPILQALLHTFRGQRGRRFGRQSFKPRGDLISGLPRLFDALEGGRLSDQHDSSEWAIIDESPDGFGLRYLRGATASLEVGELVGLRPRERERRLHICLVRRVHNGGAARLELGLQELSPQARPIELQGPMDAPPTQGIFFPALPAWRGIPGIMAPLGAIRAGSHIGIDAGQNYVAQKVLETYSRYELWQLNPI